MIYAIGELQNPLPRKTVPCGGDMNNSAGRSDAFLPCKGFRVATPHCMKGRGAAIPLLTQKGGKDSENLKKVLVFQPLLAMIAVEL